MFSKLYYSPSSPSGLRWSVNISNFVRAGDVAGWKDSKGYWSVQVKGKNYRAHRVILHLVHGFDVHSPLDVDHLDRDTSNNNVTNLRVVDRSTNLHNRSLYKTNKLGLSGVYWKKNRQRWEVRITSYGLTKTLGYFDTLLDAASAKLALCN